MIDFIDTNANDGQINHQYASKDKAFYMNVEPMIAKTKTETTIVISSKYDYMKLSGEFAVMISPYEEYHYIPFNKFFDSVINLSAVNGKITFTYQFENEQMYRIIIAEKKENDLRLFLKSSIYALDEDLYGLFPLIGDLHCHTIYSDGFESPEMTVDGAVSKGLNFLAVTDHNCYDGSVKASKYAHDHNFPITIIRGEEYSSNFTNMHIISLGADKALPKCFYEIEEKFNDRVPDECTYIENFVEQIKQNGGVSVLCHPLWKPLQTKKARMDVPEGTLKEVLEKGVFDAIEIVSGSPSADLTTSVMQLLCANEYGAYPNKISYIGVTDSHHYSTDPNCGRHFTMVFSVGNSEVDILNALRLKKTVAIQVVDENNANCYGQFRLVKYANFLLKRKFNIIN